MGVETSSPRPDRAGERAWRLSTLIDERLESLSQSAVTKGSDKQASLTPSGVQWIGDVPKHWTVARLTDVANFHSGSSGSPGGYYLGTDAHGRRCTIPCVCLGDLAILKNNERMRDFSAGHAAEWADEPCHSVLPAGAVVLSTVSHVGFCAVLDRPAAISFPFVAWVPDRLLSSDYLLFCLRAMRNEIEGLIRAGPRRTLPLRSIRAFRIPLPPLPEQAAIVSHLQRVYRHYHAVRDRVRYTARRQRASWLPWDGAPKIWFRDSVPADVAKT
jgi:type I restriction enzyme S subunit